MTEAEASEGRGQGAGGSPDEKIFTIRDERGFFPYTPHPTPNLHLSQTEVDLALIS